MLSLAREKLPKKGYRTVTIPEELYEIIREIVKNRKKYGYGNVSEFVRDALRRRLRELGYLK
mgnify:CR=1 FL=1